MKIRVDNAADRDSMAAILARNGYKVWFGKKRENPERAGSRYLWYVHAEEVVDGGTDDAGTTREPRA